MKYKRILLKLAGEALSGETGFGLNFKTLETVCQDVKKCADMGVEIAIVVGGGNSALQEAALAGIDVRLMLPARSDSKVVDLATHSYLDDMMKAGVKILFYMPGFLHSKLLIIDDMLSVIGSANMDFRSFEHNFEVNAFVYDGEFTARMASVFEEDQSRSHPLTPAEWFRRPRSRRVAESLMRVFSPLL